MVSIPVVTPPRLPAAAITAPNDGPRLGLGLVCAAALHVGLLSLGWLCGDRIPSRWLPDAAAQVEVDLVTALDPPPVDEGDPGGGSLNPDDSEPPVAGVEVPTEETRLAPAITEPDPDPNNAPPVPPAKLAPTPEEVNDEESVADEVPALQQELLIASEFALTTAPS